MHRVFVSWDFFLAIRFTYTVSILLVLTISLANSEDQTEGGRTQHKERMQAYVLAHIPFLTSGG